MSFLKGIAFLLTLLIGFIVLMFFVDPVRLIGWGFNPVNKQTAQRFLTSLTAADLKGASES